MSIRLWRGCSGFCHAEGLLSALLGREGSSMSSVSAQAIDCHPCLVLLTSGLDSSLPCSGLCCLVRFGFL